jgi:hypothetical protein
MTFHSVGNVIIPTDELIFFRGVETTNQMMILKATFPYSRKNTYQYFIILQSLVLDGFGMLLF